MAAEYVFVCMYTIPMKLARTKNAPNISGSHIKGKGDFETINPVHTDYPQITQVMIYYVATIV